MLQFLLNKKKDTPSYSLYQVPPLYCLFSLSLGCLLERVREGKSYCCKKNFLLRILFLSIHLN